MYYLDAAAWAALGDNDRAALLLRERLARPLLGKTMMTLMSSLLAIFDGNTRRAVDLMQNTEGIRDPEVLFYLARHYAMFDDLEGTVQMLRRAHLAGFWSSCALVNDPVFSTLRSHPEFQHKIREAELSESSARELLHQNVSLVTAQLFERVLHFPSQ